jgi:hypothetical protein
VLQRLILEVELHFVTVFLALTARHQDYVEVDFHRALGNGLDLVGLGELNLILHDVT